MHFLITGGTGFIGRALCADLLAQGHELTVLSRQPSERVRGVCGPVTPLGSLDLICDDARYDAVINLAGEPIADSRWTAARKAQLRASRVDVTRELVGRLARLRHKPDTLLSASAIGYYGDQGDTPLDESSPPHVEYTHTLCLEWEAEARKAETLGIRVCVLRSGLVVGRDGGFLKKMLPLFRAGLGGRIGDGKQWMSWIHLADHIAIQNFLLKDPQLSGAFNLTAPDPVTNAEFTRILAQSLKRPAGLPVPAAMLKLMLGELAGLLLGGQRVLPERILRAGYAFRFPHLQPALEDVLRP
ncbi:TIGR01777 family oxidoreductase [Methylococcus sp. EFPC2]|uniref:TIGR01777 family oxidoreductase n=1 Tax=Methylococcus sp. EFPC2 TaxID=2812648 RepID=UPI0019672F68|nr:TIGR01777 family oxidoreductase [Methylococcus sp. EFPC2]QSA96614.1 TIGR01777 family oxidoreductase [Methylococcus sp. EFPC2]